MRRSRVRAWVVGLVVGVLGCDLEQVVPGGEQERKVEPVASAEPPAPVPAPVTSSPPLAPPVGAASAAPSEQVQPILGLSAGAALAGLFANQLRVVPASERPTKDRFGTSATSAPPLGHEVTLYAVFKAPFERRLELRALDQHSAEIGRSERAAPLVQPADSSRYVAFHFDSRLPIERVRTFVVYVDPVPEVSVEEAPRPATSAKPGVKPAPRPPAPPPEPQPLDSPRPGLVPKDP